MQTIKIKPLSLNSAYRGRRFSTPALDVYKQLVIYKAQPIKDVDFTKKMQVSYDFGVSTTNSDGDNLVKCFQDALATKYGFNDNLIYKWEITKTVVKKGEEYVSFSLSNINPLLDK